MKLKVIVHTKTGNKLVYYTETWANEIQAKNWWVAAMSSFGAIHFGRFVVAKDEVDFVEFRP